MFAALMSVLAVGIAVSSDAASSDERRIDDLLKKMTIEEKAGQVNQSGFGPFRKYIESKTGLGHLVLQQGGGITAEKAAENANELQKLASKSRLGIPLLIGADGILDARVADATTFPQQVGMGSTFDPDLVHDAYAVISSEMRASGYGRTYTPNAGLARDPRFGRTGECFSEDVYLTSHLTASAVKGLQGTSLKTGIMATPKHYAAYDASIGGKDSSAMDVSERTLREVWLPPFKAAFDAGAGSVMCAYHAVNGVPCAANKHLLTDILKREWGFDGFVVTDFCCIESLHSAQHVAADMDEATRMAFEAGVDVHDHDTGDDFATRLAGLVRKGYIKESVLDEAVRRTLRAKFRLGLFDNPYVDPKQASKIVGSAEHRAVALRMARESMVLLRNSGNLLPLRDDLRSIAVIGPNADSIYNQLGVWVKEVAPAYQSGVVTILQGIRNRASSQTEIRYAKGCEVVAGFEPVPSTAFTPPDADGLHGLKGEYFSNQDLSGEPTLVRVDERIDFTWGDGSPAPEVPADRFSARWTGRLAPPTSGRYRFAADVDDGVRVFVDGKPIIDAWPDHVGMSTASMDLDAGRTYDLRVEYKENTGQAKIRLSVERPVSPDAGIREAVEAARKSDVAIVVVGDAFELNSEGHDRADLDLTGHQNALVKAVYETGVPTVVVLVNNRPLTVNYIAEHIPAILEAWNPGEEGGTAVAETLFGDYNPGGKLPITFARSMGQLPVYYDYEPGWHGATYACGTDPTPLYPFGYGLSYTTFEYSNLKLSPASIGPKGKTQVSVDVRNTGDRPGDEVVQLYIHDQVASLVRPIKQLRGFKRITLAPAEKQTVTFTLSPDDLAFYNQQMKRIVEPGTFTVMVGGNSVDLKTVNLDYRP